MCEIEYLFLNNAEEYVARNMPNKSVEQIMVDFEEVIRCHRRFNRYLKKQKIDLDMPKKSEAVLARRRLFINWYVEQNPGRRLNELIEELSLLTFTSKTTITDTIYRYR